jgi:hypothetical protein
MEEFVLSQISIAAITALTAQLIALTGYEDWLEFTFQRKQGLDDEKLIDYRHTNIFRNIGKRGGPLSPM